MKNKILQTVLITIFCLNAVAIFATTYTYETVSGVTGWRGGAAPISPLPANDFIVIDANYTWGTFGYVSSGTITVNAGKQLKFVNTFINNGTVVNNGTLITAFESSGYEGMQNTGTFTNNVGGSLQINGDAALFSNQNGGIFNNYGTLTNNFQFNNQLGGTFNNYSVCSSPNSVGTIINRGTINIPGANATMSYYCAFVNEGTINVSTGGKLAIGSSTLLTGGTINWSNGGIIALRAGLQITSGTNFIIPLGGTLILSENNNAMNLQILSGGTITNNGILQVNTAASLMVMSGGNLINNNSATFLRGVSVSSGGSFTNNSGATLTGGGGVYGTGTINNAGTFTNTSVGVYGVFNNSGTMTDGFLQVDNSINNTGTITMNLATARYVFNANPVVFPNGSFNWNAGTIEVGQPGVLTLNSDMTLNSSKILNIMGRLIIANGTSLNINFNSKLALGSNGVVTNNGTINNYGVIDNAGTIDNTSGTISLLSSGGNQSVLYLKNASSSTLPNGTFNWNSGTVGLVQSRMTVDNSMTIPANAAFQSQGSVFTIGTTGTVTNNGSFSS